MAMEVLGVVLGISTLVVRTTCTLYSLVDTWREAPEGLHRLLDDLRRSEQFCDETEAGLREMYLGLSKEARESASFTRHRRRRRLRNWRSSLFGLTIRVFGHSAGVECTYQARENAHLPQAREVLLFYNCPTWLFRGGVSVFFSSTLNGSPELTIRTVKQLLRNGRASIYDIRGNTDETPLFAALYRIDIPIVRLLFQAGADPISEAHRNPRILYEVIQTYLSARPGAQELMDMIPAFDHVELPPLHRVVSGVLHVDLEDVLCKPEYLSYLNYADPGSTWSPLDLAALRGDTVAASKLLKAGASVALKNKPGAPPLFQPCWFGHYEVAKLLVEAGADVNETLDDRGKTPIICAVNARVLLKRGSNYRFTTREGRNILHYLVEVADVEMFKIFTEAKMRGLGVDLHGNQKIKTLIEIFNERQLSVELRRAFNELLESTNNDDDELSDEGDEFHDAPEQRDR
ncbi:ankyrin repeat-containing domain protein [Triangularia setosa]|uniref:Ankyrin repeat-containing domain protein n=1 Tax=Triangularia setosa TaxID=2587417 RepID=A0AAN7A5P1_9PEZI|nr:ankyrin repeat-containing domain protein [Podospora setosa]